MSLKSYYRQLCNPCPLTQVPIYAASHFAIPLSKVTIPVTRRWFGFTSGVTDCSQRCDGKLLSFHCLLSFKSALYSCQVEQCLISLSSLILLLYLLSHSSSFLSLWVRLSCFWLSFLRQLAASISRAITFSGRSLLSGSVRRVCGWSAPKLGKTMVVKSQRHGDVSSWLSQDVLMDRSLWSLLQAGSTTNIPGSDSFVLSFNELPSDAECLELSWFLLDFFGNFLHFWDFSVALVFFSCNLRKKKWKT